jgi:hypothetical protein
MFRKTGGMANDLLACCGIVSMLSPHNRCKSNKKVPFDDVCVVKSITFVACN